MQSLIAKLIASPFLKGALQVPVAQVVAQVEPFFSPHYFRHACATPLTTLLIETEELDIRMSKKQLLERHRRLRCSVQQLRTLFTTCYFGTHAEYFSVSLLIANLRSKIASIGSAQFYFLDFTNKSTAFYGSYTHLIEAIFCIIKNATEAYDGEKKKVVVITARQVKQKILIEVQDFGKGMNILATVVSQYPGVSYKQTGTGLGISFARRVARECFNGSLSVKSSSGEGTTVTFTLPSHTLGTRTL